MYGKLLALVMSCAVIGACGSVDEVAPDATGSGIDGGTPDGGSAQATLDDVCNATDGVFVELFGEVLGCFPEFELIFATDITNALLEMVCRGSLGPVVEDGTVVLGDTAALAACRAFLATITCENFELGGGVPEDCEALIQGTIALGDDCDTNDQCEGEAFCDRGDGSGCGTCTARLADDMPCNSDDDCANGYCKGLDEGEGTPGTCATPGEAGDDCEVNDDCIGRMICDRATDKCASEPAWTVGTPCAEFPFDCNGIVGDHYCDGPELGNTNECVAYLNVGDTCGMDTPLCKIFQFESCQMVGGGGFECVAATTTTTGMPCGFFQGIKCPDGDTCVDHDGNGATAERCVTFRTEGQSCNDTDQPCGPFLECHDGTCAYNAYSGECPDTSM